MEPITLETDLPYKTYKKKTPTIGRFLTEYDYEQREGAIQTLEGPKPFIAGDFLAHDSKGEWPITRKELLTKYLWQGKTPGHEFLYLKNVRVQAVQLHYPHTIQGFNESAAGYYVIKSETDIYPCDAEIFESGYQRV